MGSAQCAKHQFEPAVAFCRDCGSAFCSECLVYTFGPHKPPYCIPCALVAAGIRRQGAGGRRENRARRRALRDVALLPAQADALLGARTPGGIEPDFAEQGRRTAAGRGVVGALAVVAAVVAVVVPVATHFA